MMCRIPVESASIVSLRDEKHVGFQSMVEDILQVARTPFAQTESTAARNLSGFRNWLSACSAAVAMRFLA
ncbi:hypothetical protein MJ581_18135 [Escherichia coli]|nr:hypothetical protein MJ581_18135 [Escherichia coli]